jgi:hypothetical protein
MHLWKKYGHWLLLLLWLILLTPFFLFSYQTFFNFLIAKLGIENHREAFAGVFSPAVFIRLKLSLAGLFGLSLLLYGIILKNSEKYSEIKSKILKSLNFPLWLKTHFLALAKIERIGVLALLVLVVIHRMFLAASTGVIYDEAYTWLAFTSKNPLVAACFYPTSNNHILFSHLTQITKFLPFDILTNLRLGALLPNLVSIITLFFCLRIRFSNTTTWISILVFAFSFPLIYYGFVARGYSLLLFFFIIGFFSTLTLLNNPQNIGAWVRLIISSALGFYTIPVYLYPFVSLYGFLAIHFFITAQYKPVLNAIISGIITIVITCLLYLPVFAISGTDAVLNNKFVQSLTFAQVFSGLQNHWINSLRFLSGYQSVWLAIVALGALLVFSIYLTFKESKIFSLSLFCLLIAPLLMILHRIIPVERTWIYLMIPLIYLLANALQSFKNYAFLGYICLFVPLFAHFQLRTQMLWYDKACMEDALQGEYFTKYFHVKKVTVSSSTRMNAYLKFNRVLKSEDWTIQNSINTTSNEGEYIIQYLADKEIDNIPTGYKPVVNYEGYRLLQYQP